MMSVLPLWRESFDAPCTLEIGHTAESLFAHVEIEGDYRIQPGDRVLVQHAPAELPFGRRVKISSRATIVRAGLIERLWTRLAGNFAVTELYDVSFTDRRAL